MKKFRITLKYFDEGRNIGTTLKEVIVHCNSRESANAYYQHTKEQFEKGVRFISGKRREVVIVEI